MAPDLSKKMARPLVMPEALPILDWPTLLQASGLPGGQDPVQKNPVRMLGYMMDLERPIPDDCRVQEFALLAEAGTLLHPAHRRPEQMVDVRVKKVESVLFKARTLVWVQGWLSPQLLAALGERPAHVLLDAAVQRADWHDIDRYFVNP